MYSIKVPSELKIGGHTFKVVNNSDLDADGNRATINFKYLVISIHPHKKSSIKAQGFIHEIMHGIDLIYLNRQIDSDNIIEPLAEGLWQILDQLGIELDFGALEDETRKEEA